MKQERNICHDIGCKGSCCANIRGQYKAREEWFKLAFPEAVKLDDIKFFNEIMHKNIKGTFYLHNNGWNHILINGVCQNLTEEKTCKVHHEPFYPGMCSAVKPNQEECREIMQKLVVRASTPCPREDRTLR